MHELSVANESYIDKLDSPGSPASPQSSMTAVGRCGVLMLPMPGFRGSLLIARASSPLKVA